jgi:uncharacterized protein (TIGR03437 family)
MPLRIALFLISVTLAAQVPFTHFAVFGDSLSDNGNVLAATTLLGAPQPVPPLYATGEFTDGANSVPSTSAPLGLWIEQLAAKMGLPVPQPFAKGGTNYAIGSAQTGSNPAFGPGKLGVPYVTDQVNQFLTANHTASPNFFYTFWCGANDILAGADPATVVANVHANIETLVKAGGKYFFWANQPPIGEAPQSVNTAQRAPLDAAAVTSNNAWTTAIASLLAEHPGITIVAFDAYSGTQLVLQNPSLYGFVNITSPAQGLANVDPNTYFYWDTLHPTTAVNALVADGALDTIQSAFNGAPFVSSVANAFGGSAIIAPNTWVAIKGSLLSAPTDSRIWLGSDFVNNQMPTALDQVSVTMNGEKAYVYYISPTQLNILTPPDLAPGTVEVQVTANGHTSGIFLVQSQTLSPSFFVFDGTHVIAAHLAGGDVGPTTLFPGLTTPAKPGEEVVMVANGFGVTSAAIVPGAPSQSGSLATLPVVMIGGIQANVLFAGLIGPGLFQFNVTVPSATPDGDIPLVATYQGATTPTGAVITVHQ